MGERHKLVSRRHSRGHPHIGERAIDETAHSNQRTVEYGPRCAGYPDIACFDGRHGKSGRVEKIPQLVRQKAQPLVQGSYAIVLYQGVFFLNIYGACLSNYFDETAVECS